MLEQAKLKARGAVDRVVSRFTDVPGGTLWEKTDGTTGETIQLHRREHYVGMSTNLRGVIHPDGTATAGKPGEIVHIRDGESGRLHRRFTLQDAPDTDGYSPLSGLDVSSLRARAIADPYSLSEVFSWSKDTVQRELPGPQGNPLGLLRKALGHMRF